MQSDLKILNATYPPSQKNQKAQKLKKAQSLHLPKLEKRTWDMQKLFENWLPWYFETAESSLTHPKHFLSDRTALKSRCHRRLEKSVSAFGTRRILWGSHGRPRGRLVRTDILLRWVEGDSGMGLLRSLSSHWRFWLIWLQILASARPQPAFFCRFSAFLLQKLLVVVCDMVIDVNGPLNIVWAQKWSSWIGPNQISPLGRSNNYFLRQFLDYVSNLYERVTVACWKPY